MIRFCQPNDHYHQGRNVWFNPSDIISITGEAGECWLTLRNGEKFRLGISKDEAAQKINEALATTERKETK